MKRLVSILWCLACVASIHANGALQKSDKMMPRWVKYVPKSENVNIEYRVIQVYVDRLEDMHKKSLQELTNYIPQSWNVSHYSEWQTKGNGSNEIQVLMEGSPYSVPMNCQEIDTYWECVQLGSYNRYRCYVLYQVVRPGARAVEYTRLTEKYGFGAGALSIIPGAGQLYKGSIAKGVSFMVTDVACVAGVVLCESTRVSYAAKMKQQPKHAQEYSTLANNWSTGRNICIGVTAGIWLWNIIDAFVANGARRVIVKPNRGYVTMTPSYQINPITSTADQGFGIAYHF